MELPDVRSLLPHSGAMVLLDRVVAIEDDRLSAEVSIRPDSLFYRAGGVGAWVGMEYMAQAIAAYVGHLAQARGEPVKVGFLLGLRRYECSRPVFERGSVLRVHVKCILHSENGLGSFDCYIEDANEKLASATVTVFRPGDAIEVFRESRQ